MGGDPAGDSHPDGGQLLGAHPDSRQPLHPARLDSEFGDGGDEDLFDLPEEEVQIPEGRREQKDGVAHQLARAVVGHVPSASRLEHLHSPSGQILPPGEEVIGIGSPPQGHHGRVFEQEEGVLPRTLLAARDQRLLKGEPLRVGNPPEPSDLHSDDATSVRRPDRVEILMKRHGVHPH